jgi:plastocyanin
MIRRAALAVALLIVLSTSGVSAATRTVEVFNFGFNAKALKIPMGDSVRWHNGTQTDHTSTANMFGLWSQNLSGPSTSPAVLFQRAGTFAYRCVIHPTKMKGSIGVRMRATPGSGTTSTNFLIRVALSNAPSGFIEDIQMRKVPAAFGTWRTTTLQTQAFRATSAGTYEFRSRLRKTSDGTFSGWSPVLSVRVT